MGSRKLVIFGAGAIAQLALFYFSHDSDYEVVAFTVDRDYCDGDQAFGLPLIPFDRLAECYRADEYVLFIALSYARLNEVRRQKYEAGKALGYRFASYISTRASTFPGFSAGENCFILEDNTIQPFATIGDNVTLWSGNHIGHHSQIGSHCFIASQVVISGGVKIGEQCFIGVNATLRDHIVVGERCVIGAGALVMADAAADGVYIAPASERSKVPSHRLRGI